MPARNALRLHIARPLAVEPSTPNRSLIPDKIPNASECESQFRIGPRSNLVGNDICGLKRRPRGVGHPRKMLGLSSTAKHDAEAHPVGHGTQQSLAGIEAIARLFESRLMGV